MKNVHLNRCVLRIGPPPRAAYIGATGPYRQRCLGCFFTLRAKGPQRRSTSRLYRSACRRSRESDISLLQLSRAVRIANRLRALRRRSCSSRRCIPAREADSTPGSYPQPLLIERSSVHLLKFSSHPLASESPFVRVPLGSAVSVIDPDVQEAILQPPIRCPLDMGRQNVERFRRCRHYRFTTLRLMSSGSHKSSTSIAALSALLTRSS